MRLGSPPLAHYTKATNSFRVQLTMNRGMLGAFDLCQVSLQRYGYL